MNFGERLNHIPARCAILCAGFAVMAFGIAFSIKAGLGTSPVSSVPYVASAISGLSVGTTTIPVSYTHLPLVPEGFPCAAEWLGLSLPSAGEGRHAVH